MAAFNFPDPTVQQTVVNPITGSTYQWKEPPGKWVLTVSVRDVSDIIWEGDNPPIPIGDYKLWYSTDTLELYFYYCDANGVCAWVPTSVPIQVLEDLNAFAAQAEVDIDQLQYKQQILQNTVDQIYLDSQTGAGNRPPIFSATEPDKHPDYTPPQDELISGDIWYDNTDPENLEQYIYDGTQWIVFGGQFVHRKGGDTMEGPLSVMGGRDPDADGIESTVKVYNVDSGRNGDLQLKRAGQTKIYCSTDGISVQGNLKMNVEASKLKSSTNTELLTFNKAGIFYEGTYTAEKHIATKKNLDDTEQILQNGIIELAEEIEAIAPSVERGLFVSTTRSNVPVDGEFMLKTVTGKTTAYDNPDIAVIEISKQDNDGITHTFADVEEGQYLQLFEADNSDYGLYRIDAIAGVGGATTVVTFTVTPVSGLGEATEGDLARLKIFSAPEGGTADGFVLKTGDTMSGNLTIDKSTNSTNSEAGLILKGSRPSTTNSAATITFENDQSNDLGYLTYRSFGSGQWFAFNQDVDLNSNGLHSVGRIRMQSGAYIGSGTNQRIVIRNGSSGEAGVEVKRTADNTRILTILGKPSGSNSSSGNFFYAYANSGSGGDAINYTGKIDSSSNLVNKGYVDSKLPQYTITKNNGNYYVS